MSNSKTIDERIKEVCSLKAGWLNGEGEAVHVNPTWVEFVVNALRHAGMKTPTIFATPEGYVQLEWSDGKTLVIEQ